MKLTERKFGIEIEISTRFDDIEQEIFDFFNGNNVPINIVCTDEKSDGSKWELKTDGSTGAEIASPIMCLYDKNYYFMKKLLHFMRKKKYKVTKSDGLHVHFDVSEIHKNHMLIAWLYAENSVRNIMPKKRMSMPEYDVSYARRYIWKTSRKMIADYFKSAQDDADEHYAALSFEKYDARGTVEFRMHEGTIDYKEITNWVKFCLYFIRFTKTIDPLDIIFESTDSLSSYSVDEEMKLPKKIIEWYDKRFYKFGMG